MPTVSTRTLNGLVSALTTGSPDMPRAEILPDALGGVVRTSIAGGTSGRRSRCTPHGSDLLSAGGWFLPRNGWVGAWGYRSTQTRHSEQYVRARHYSSAEARWTGVDPLWPDEPAYGYVGGNPTTWTDPSGLKCRPPQKKGPCGDLGRKGPSGACKAGLCSLKTASDLAKYLKSLAGLIDPETLKQWLDLLKKLKAGPPTSPDECCKKAGASKATTVFCVRSLDDAIDYLCNGTGKIQYDPSVCASLPTTHTVTGCESCCDRSFPQKVGDETDSNRSRCYGICTLTGSNKGWPDNERGA